MAVSPERPPSGKHAHDHNHGQHDLPKKGYSVKKKDGFVPGLFDVTSNLPGAATNRDGSECKRKIVYCHEDPRTSGGSVVIPWAQFDKRDADGKGGFDWDFVDEQSLGSHVAKW